MHVVGRRDGDRVDLTVNTGATDVFRVVQDAIDALRFQGPGESGYRTHELARTLTEMDASLDRVLLARGRVVRRGRRVIFLEGELFDEAGTVLARSTSTAIPTPRPGDQG